MRNINRRFRTFYIAIFTAILLPAVFVGQVKPYNGGIQTRALITEPVDDGQIIALTHNTRSEANAANDRGAVPDSFPIEHMLLQLQRPPELEREMVNLIDEMHKPGSPVFHQWLTPGELGRRFGLSGQDIRKISDWLVSHGFQVNAVFPTGLVIDFSGTAAQVRSAFHTEIHNLDVNGETHIANMQDPQIPAALAGAVQGVVSLHNFMPHSSFKKRTAFDATISGSTYEAVAPGDLATIYNLNPLFAAGLTGVGQTIAVIEDTSIKNASDVATFRSSFGLSGYPGTFSQLLATGTTTCRNPGVNGNEDEAALDAEWAGAAAPGAAILLAYCADTTSVFGGLIALENLVNAGSPPAIVSISYGECEAQNGASANASYVQAYELAAAQGVSVFVSAGDAGAAVCDADLTTASHGIAVNGFASTPYNVAVGGTDFSDSYSGTVGTYWNPTNTPTGESAISYIPEIPWNDSCASELIFHVEGYIQGYGSAGFCNTTTGHNFLTTSAGSGGPSTYSAQPSWQSVFGLPTASGGPRYLPDVSLFAANGVWGHFYVYCMSDTAEDGSPCNYSNTTDLEANTAGGTSFSSPIMAGIMALVNQKAGAPQGLPNPRIYALAAAEYGTSGSTACNSSLGNSVGSSCFFYDVTLGDMDVPCTGTLSCFGYLHSGSTTTYGALSTSTAAFNTAYGAAAGWDFATGIGTVNAYNLVYGWVPASTATITTSGLNPSTYGASVEFTATITSQNNQPIGGTVAWSTNTGCGTTPVTAGASGVATCTTSVLPGGSDTVTATYSSDITHLGSSGSVTQQVSAIAPTVTFTGAPASAPYNSTFTVSSTTNASTTASIVASGACSVSGNTVMMTSGTGTCSLTATWAADNNYTSATAAQTTTASKLAPTVTFTGAPASAPYNSRFTVSSTTNASTAASILATGACSILTSTVTMTSGTGTCSLTATWAADNNYNSATAAQSTTATKLAPTVTFTGAPSSAPYNSTFNVSSTTNASTMASILAGGVCSISTTTVTMTSGTGTCSLTATWAADNNYSSATAAQSTTATKLAPAVTFTGAPASAPYNSTFNVSSTTNASTTASIIAGGACSISGNTVTMTSATGTCTLTATWAADNNYNAATATQSTTASSGVGSGPQAWPNGYNYQATFTVAAGQVPSAQTNFPALISGTFADFATTANGGRISNTCTQTVGNNATTVPCDLIFTSDAAGTMLLNWEFETYTATTGTVNLWVNAPNLANGTVIYAWYGQPGVTTLQTTPSATWSSNFMAVYHLKENPAGTAPQLNDSTSNGNNGTMNGTVLASQQQPGEIDGSVNFEGDTWASLANPANFSFERTDSFSVSGWFNIPSNSTGTLLSKYAGAPGAGWALLQFPGSSRPVFALGLFGTGSSTFALAETPGVTEGAWHHVVATYSGTSTVAGMNVYVDGVNQTLTTLGNNLSTSILNTVTPAINGRAGPVYMSTDTMDELRVSAKGVVFTPAYVTATFNNQSNPGTFFTAVTGLTNTSTASLSPAPSSIGFPNQTVNTTSSAQAITLTNNGPGAATIASIAITGTNPGDFAQTNNCPLSPATLAANAFCTINVTFTPLAANARSAAVSITSSGNSPSVSLTGTGTAVPSTVTLAPSSISFANQTVNTTSGAQTITVTNSGPSTLAITTIAITGTNQGDFAQTNNCPLSPTTIAVNGFCTINVTFTPAAANLRSAAITITDNGASSPQSVSLSGTGTAVPSTVTLAPTAVSFPNQTVNTTSGAQTITLTNSGPSPLTITTIAITGTNPGDFAQTNNCPLSPTTIAVNGFCTINVTFTPAAANLRSAAITITDNGASSPQSVSLSGTGTAVPSTVTLAPTAVSFPNQTVNTTSGAQTITLTNSGPSPLTITTIAITGTNPGDFAQTNNCPLSPTTIAVNGFCTINVTFTPAAVNLRSAAITITDNGASSPQSVSLSGTGIAAGPQAWPNGYNYQATFTVAAGQVPSAQTNFPALISGTFADFATTANGGRIANTCTQTVGNNATTVPCDLIFTSDAAGIMLLNWEFETYTATTGAVNLWVNAPNLANGTVIYAWYGQPAVTTLQTTPSATWSSNFMAVYHLKENPAGTAPQLNDSTSNGNNATMNGTVLASQQQPGEIDGSVNFEGDTWASLANPANFSFERTDSFSVSGWFNIPSNTTGTLLSKYAGAPGAGWALLQFPGSSRPVFAFGLFGTGSSTFALAETPGVTEGAWHHVVATYSGTGTVAGMNVYVDGVSQTLTTLGNNLSTSILNTVTPAINGRAGPVQMSTDTMDELRVSAKGVVFTPAWVTATFNNQSKPGTFFTAVTGLTNP